MARIPLVLVAAFAVTASSSKGQAAFDVASIRQLDPPYPTGGGPWTAVHGQFKATTAWPRGVIAFAFDVVSAQVRGGPAWLDSDRYDFDARSENQQASVEELRAMLRMNRWAPPRLAYEGMIQLKIGLRANGASLTDQRRS